MSQELSRYLQALSREGEQHSQGGFSIDYGRALEQLSSRLHSDPSSYLLKLIQGAVRSGAWEIRIKTHRDRLEVHFPSRRLGSQRVRQLPQLLLDPLPGGPDESGLGHLLRALHAARAGQATSLAFVARDSSGGESVLLQGDQIGLRSLEAGDQDHCECCFSLQRPVRKSWWSPSSFVAEQQSLAQRACLCPVPIRWDGRLLNPRVPTAGAQGRELPWLLDRIYLSCQPADVLLTLPPSTQLGAYTYDLGRGYQDHFSYGSTLLQQWRVCRSNAPFPSGPPPQFDIYESNFIQEITGLPPAMVPLNHGGIRPGRLQGRNNGYQILYTDEPDPFRRSQFGVPHGRFGSLPTLAAQAWFRCPSHPQGPSQLHLCQDGIRLDPLALELPLQGVQVYLAGAARQWEGSPWQVPTDLSGLTVRQEESVSSLISWVREETLRAKRELRQALRWTEKYGFSDHWLKTMMNNHSLDRDD